MFTKLFKPAVCCLLYLLCTVCFAQKYSELNDSNAVNYQAAEKGMYKSQTIRNVLPREFYESKWFQLVSFLFVMTGIWKYTQSRTKYLQIQNEQLETALNICTQSLKESHDAQQRTEKNFNSQMFMISMMVTSISHDIRTPMKYLISASDDVQKMIISGKYHLASQVSRDISVSARNMSDLLDNILTYIRSRSNGVEIVKKQVLLYPLVMEKMALFQLAIKAQCNKVTLDIAKELTVLSDPQLLAVLLHNLIDNANKFTFEGAIRIYAETKNDSIHLTISDTGKGMSVEMTDWLNGRDPENSIRRRMGASERHTGLGLLIVKEISVTIQCSIFVEVSEGTSVHLIFNT